jgi:hypothetical protein
MTNWCVARHRVSIAGRVRDGRTKKAIAGVEVSIVGVMPAEFRKTIERLSLRAGKGWDRRAERVDKTKSGFDGLFHFQDLPHGKYGLRAALPDCGKRYGEAEGEAAVPREAQGESGRDYLKKIWVDLELPPTTVRGRVIDANQKAGVWLAEVRVKGSGERTFSDAQGQFAIFPIEPGTRVLQASAQGYSPLEEISVAQAGREQETDFRLVRKHG